MRTGKATHAGAHMFFQLCLLRVGEGRRAAYAGDLHREVNEGLR